jgi:hypothetical protein
MTAPMTERTEGEFPLVLFLWSDGVKTKEIHGRMIPNQLFSK